MLYGRKKTVRSYNIQKFILRVNINESPFSLVRQACTPGSYTRLVHQARTPGLLREADKGTFSSVTLGSQRFLVYSISVVLHDDPPKSTSPIEHLHRILGVLTNP